MTSRVHATHLTMKQFLNFIDGEFVATGRTFDKRAPVDNRVIGAVHEAGQAEVDAAVAAARAALKGPWGRMTVVQRVEMLHAVADEIDRRFDDFLAAELADTGKPRSLASHIDIPRGAANFKVFADMVKNVENGIYIIGDGSFSIDQQRYNAQFGGQLFYEIKNGKITQQIEDVAYQIRTPEFWNACTAVCDESDYRLGGSFFDGKGQPGQVSAVSHGSSTARFNGINVINTARSLG